MPLIKVSVIIPTLNEASVLASTLETLGKYKPCEIIIGDGGSEDGTQAIAGKFNIRVVTSPPGRALQMNAAAGLARGDTLLFLHADSIMEPDGYWKMVRLMAEGRIAGGAFSLRIQSARWSLRLISRVATWRAKYLRIVYGDQAIFVRGEVFRRMGGFSPIPICEDMDFFNRLKREGKTVILEEQTTTSPRRWQAEGVLYTTLRNWLIAGLFLLGFPPRILSKWYLTIR